MIGNAYGCLLTQDNTAISGIGWVEGSALFYHVLPYHDPYGSQIF